MADYSLNRWCTSCNSYMRIDTSYSKVYQSRKLINSILPRLQCTLMFTFHLQLVDIQLAVTSDFTWFKDILSKPGHTDNRWTHTLVTE